MDIKINFPFLRQSKHKNLRGFTLLEIIVTLSMLATFVLMAGTIIRNVLDTERIISKQSAPEKIGQGIMSIVRKDLMGVVYKNLGEKVFQVIDNGDGPLAQDEIQFFTTVASINPENLAGDLLDQENTEFEVPEESTLVSAVHWFLRDSNFRGDTQLFTLFRKENALYGSDDPFEAGGGLAYEVYDKVRGFSVEVFDGYEWFTVWDSRANLEQEAEDVAAEEEGNSNLEGVATGSNISDSELDDPDAYLEDIHEQLAPPVAIPVAVRVSVTFLAGDEKGAYVKDNSTTGEFEEYTYSTIVRLLTSLRIPMNIEDAQMDAEGGGLAGGPGGEGTTTTTSGRVPEEAQRAGRGGRGGRAGEALRRAAGSRGGARSGGGRGSGSGGGGRGSGGTPVFPGGGPRQ